MSNPIRGLKRGVRINLFVCCLDCFHFLIPQAGVPFQARFEAWSQFHEAAVLKEISDFIDQKMKNSDELIKSALLACVSSGKLVSGHSHFDHRHLFEVPKLGEPLKGAFIASPFLPPNWRSDIKIGGTGVCTSGIANTAAAALLRSKFNAGAYFYISRAIPTLASS